MGLARSRATWGPKVANTFLKKQQRKLAWEDTRPLNEMEEKAKEYEEEAIAREERLMMQVEDHRGNQREERRYLATRSLGYLPRSFPDSSQIPPRPLPYPSQIPPRSLQITPGSL